MEHSFENIIGMTDNVIDNDLHELIVDYFKKYEEDFVKCPGSIGHHHAYTGGLLDHTIEVCDLALEIGNNSCIELQDEKNHMEDESLLDDPNYMFWNDRLLISALLHDIGKINQYQFNGTRWMYKMTKEESKDYDHAVWVVSDFRKVCRINLPGEIREAILSHHGGWATNGAKCDNLLDAIVHSADLISSRM